MVSSARKIPLTQTRLCTIKALSACRSTVVIRSRWVSCKPYAVLYVAGLAFCSLLLETVSLMLPLRSCACRITSKTVRPLALPTSVNRHSAVQHSPLLPPPCLDNLISRNLRTPCLVHSAMPVPVVRLREVPLAGWVKHRRNRRGDLVGLSTVLSSRPSNRPSSRRRVASDPSTRLLSNSNLRMLVCSGAAVHLQPKINRWAASVCLITSLRIINLPYHRQYWGLRNEFQHWIYWSFWTDQYHAATTACFYRSVWAKSASW